MFFTRDTDMIHAIAWSGIQHCNIYRYVQPCMYMSSLCVYKMPYICSASQLYERRRIVVLIKIPPTRHEPFGFIKLPFPAIFTDTRIPDTYMRSYMVYCGYGVCTYTTLPLLFDNLIMRSWIVVIIVVVIICVEIEKQDDDLSSISSRRYADKYRPAYKYTFFPDRVHGVHRYADTVACLVSRTH